MLMGYAMQIQDLVEAAEEPAAPPRRAAGEGFRSGRSIRPWSTSCPISYRPTRGLSGRGDLGAVAPSRYLVEDLLLTVGVCADLSAVQPSPGRDGFDLPGTQCPGGGGEPSFAVRPSVTLERWQGSR